ncbi:aldose epimerase family protein [Rheinheimera oceanensis]|uniref:aldose epimerase family protein n=1 Tax=Rheinheimera oceanensis TaxID=2817449 RepID=UPI001BFDE17E
MTTSGQYNHLQPLHLTDGNGLELDLLPFGATISAIRLDGQQITLGYVAPELFLHDSFYLGASIGRFANRIANGRCRLNGQPLTLNVNNGGHCLHGGTGGFHRADWQVLQQAKNSAELYYCAADGEQGFPGRLEVWQQISLQDAAVSMRFRARADKDTLINLTNHCYFNLNTDGSSIENHQLQLNAGHYLPTDSSSIPTGRLQAVAGSAFDFLRPRTIADALAQGDAQLQLASGFDHCFVTAAQPYNALHQQARLHSAQSGLTLTVYSTQPGIQLYSGNFLAAPFAPRQGLCLEAQNWPDAPNQSGFPSALLLAGHWYVQEIIYSFQ